MIIKNNDFSYALFDDWKPQLSNSWQWNIGATAECSWFRLISFLQSWTLYIGIYSKKKKKEEESEVHSLVLTSQLT